MPEQVEGAVINHSLELHHYPETQKMVLISTDDGVRFFLRDHDEAKAVAIQILNWLNVGLINGKEIDQDADCWYV